MAERDPDDVCDRAVCRHNRGRHANGAGTCLVPVPAALGSIHTRPCRCRAFYVHRPDPQLEARRQAMAAGRPLVAHRP